MQRMEHAYEDWRSYRDTMTSYILTHTGADTHLAIFGAGACNDIDLARLISHFRKITLIDTESESLKQAFQTYQLTDYPMIQTLVCELTGIHPNRYEEFSELLLEHIRLFGSDSDEALLSETALSYLSDVYEHLPDRPVVFAADSFDYSVSFGLHSQLNNMFAWIWETVTASLPHKSPAVLSYLAEQTPSLVKTTNDMIFHCTKNAIFFANERKNIALDTPVAGAMECILDVRERSPSCATAVVDWPFLPAQNIRYQMLLQTVTL